MRDQLRDMIAVKMHTVDCGCADWTPDSPDVHTPDATDFYLRLAAAALELFPEVEKQGRLDWSTRWWSWDRWTGRRPPEPAAFSRFAAYTAEVPEETPR